LFSCDSGSKIVVSLKAVKQLLGNTGDLTQWLDSRNELKESVGDSAKKDLCGGVNVGQEEKRR
jgi:hypothetical protein